MSGNISVKQIPHISTDIKERNWTNCYECPFFLFVETEDQIAQEFSNGRKRYLVVGRHYCCPPCGNHYSMEGLNYGKKWEGLTPRWCPRLAPEAVNTNAHQLRRTCLDAPERKPSSRFHEQPCWHCKKYNRGCEWSKEFKPVPGWDAKPTHKSDGLHSYRIFDCPQFEDDGTLQRDILYRKEEENEKP